jgi:16S rRNA (uracil1498-N3)-methyltransferase
MKRVLTPDLPKLGSPVELSESEAKHLVKVLRMRDGETIEAIDGKGHAMEATLRIRGKSAFLFSPEASSKSAERMPQEMGAQKALEQLVPVTLELAVLKGDAMEWTVEKAVELGIKRLIPTLTAYTVVQVSKKGPAAYQERWQRIADQALKQCGRLERLEVLPPLALPELLTQFPSSADCPRIWCDEDKRNTAPELALWLRSATAKEARLLIGPEGGFNDVERQLLQVSASPVSLGPLVLRAETASVAACGLLAAHFRALKA